MPPPFCATWRRPATRRSFRPISCGSTASGRFTSPSIASWAPARCRSSTTSKRRSPTWRHRISRPGIKMNVVMDQSVYVRQSISSLAQEGILGAVLCSLVIFLFLGEWRMTAIAVLMIPIAVTAAVIGLKVTGNTINVMTLAGMALAIGPLVDAAIVCLENTYRHLTRGRRTAAGRLRGGQRSRPAGARRQPVHAAGPCRPWP